MYLLQDQLLFPGADSSAGVYYRYHNSEHSLEREGIRLQGWHRRNPQGRPQQVLLYFGGNAEDGVTALPMLDSLGAEHAYTFNYRGYGQSQGKPSQAALFADALAIFDQLAQNHPQGEFVVIGRSLGSAMAGHVASQRSLQGLILLTPLKSAKASGQRTYPFLPVGLLIRHPLDLHAIAPQIQAPSLVLIAEQDRVINPEHSLATFAALAGAKQLVRLPGVGHNNLFDNPQTLASMQAFLDQI